MKILLSSYNHKPFIGGIETYSNELKKYLENTNYKCIFVTQSFSKYKLLRIIKIISISTFKLIFNKIDVVHITNINLWPIVLTNYFKKNKTVFFINLHGLELIYGNRKKIVSKIYNIYVPYKFINKLKNLYFFTNSRETLKIASPKLSKSKIKYIPMGVSRCLKIKTNENVNLNQFFYLGRITKRKGIKWFVEEVLPSFPEKKLLLGGPIVDLKEFEEISKSKQVDYIGVLEQKEIIELHRSSFLTIFPNFIDNNELDFEGFGISFLEAISNGGLPITTLYQGLKSATLGGKIGICMNDNVASTWLSKIEETASQGLSYRKKIIENSQQLINENFLWEDIFESTMNEYKKLFQ